VCVDMNWK